MALACGCAEQRDVASVGPEEPRPVSPDAIAGPYVQAGTPFRARIDQPIDTFYTPPGTLFAATVVTPLRGSRGETIVPDGAKLRGTIASVGTWDAPQLRVKIDSIDTVAGTLPVQAAVRHAEHTAWAGPATLQPAPSKYGPDTYIYPYDFFGYGSDYAGPAPTGPAEPLYGYSVERPREIRVPSGALVELVLVRPLVLPGARVRR
jgi:hypothetical protein